MRPIIAIFGLLFLCGCTCISNNTIENTPSQENTFQTKEPVVREIEPTSSTEHEHQEEPYGKYNLETADIQWWFYDNHYVYFDGEHKVLKTYETIDTDSN